MLHIVHTVYSISASTLPPLVSNEAPFMSELRSDEPVSYTHLTLPTILLV